MCDHPRLSLDEARGGRVTGERDIPRQVQFDATCQECGETVIVDYNIAFVDGQKA